MSGTIKKEADPRWSKTDMVVGEEEERPESNGFYGVHKADSLH